MMRFDIITLFPGIFSSVFNDSILKRAQDKKLIAIHTHQLRDYTKDKHRKVDDRPFGGGPGMLIGPQPVFDAVKKIKGKRKVHVILMDPAGKPFKQSRAKQLTKFKNLLIICGHYEGIDERVRQNLVDESISIGDYVLTGGEVPAMVVLDAVARLVPGVLGRKESLQTESFENNLLEAPAYTRPANFRGLQVPKILLSGNHAEITRWQNTESLKRTQKQRPDLIKK